MESWVRVSQSAEINCSFACARLFFKLLLRPLFLCTKRQKGRLERTAKPQAQGSIPAAAAGRPDRDDTATEPVGAGALDGRKWSPEAKNGHAGCQKGRLDGRAESDPSEQNNTMRSHGTFHFLSPLSNRFYWFCEWCSAAKNRPLRLRFGFQAAIRVVPSLGPMGAPQRLLQAGRGAMRLQPDLSEQGSDMAESGPVRPKMGMQAAGRVD